MNLNINALAILLAFIGPAQADADTFLSDLVREQALAADYKLPHATHAWSNRELSKVGKVFFETKNLSLNGNISCATCHIDKLGSSDGLPNSIGIGGEGESIERFRSGGRIIPRNSLSLFGVGGKGFKAFFWDGRVERRNAKIKSPFGNEPPVDDALVVAVHLPVAEIRETLQEDDFVSAHKLETVEAANQVYAAVVKKLTAREPKAMLNLASATGKRLDALKMEDVASALAEFIRDKFRLRPSKFSQFMEGKGKLSEDELKGGIIFYGKGQCSSCHRGPYFSDFDYHTIAFPQAGFGKNGFGVDYGRYNSTFNPEDLYKFRTPSLHNITKTFPYGHSGSIMDLKRAISMHLDPLDGYDAGAYSTEERIEFTKYVANHSISLDAEPLSEKEIEYLHRFLETLEFEIDEK
jgi:cytochrome c peroxidase